MIKKEDDSEPDFHPKVSLIFVTLTGALVAILLMVLLVGSEPGL